MAAEAKPVSAEGRAIRLGGRFHYQGTLIDSRGERYLIRPLLPNDDYPMKRFLTEKAAPSYSHEDAVKRFEECKQRHLDGTPFSMYPIFHKTGRQIAELGCSELVLVGYYTIESDSEIGYLCLEAMIDQAYQRRGIMKAVSMWTKLFLKEMIKQEVTVERTHLSELKIRALAHPENEAATQALEKEGFRFQQVINTSKGLRRVYEIPVRKLLNDNS